MALYNANLMIRESRKARGLTQEQLAEGICARETIVKLEKGARKPNWFVFREILRRLGLEDSVYQDVIGSEEDVSAYHRLNKCYALVNMHKYDEIQAEIASMEAEPMWRNGVWYEMLLRFKILFYTHGISTTAQANKYINAPLAIEYAMEALQLTRPNFDTNKILEYFLATHEYRTLRLLASAYTMVGKTDEAIKIWQDLKAHAEDGHSVHISGTLNAMNAEYRLVLTALALTLLTIGRYEECLQIAEENLSRFHLGYESPVNYANHLALKADALRALGRVDESKAFEKKSLLLHYVFDGFLGINFDSSKKRYEEQYGGKLDLSVPW